MFIAWPARLDSDRVINLNQFQRHGGLSPMNNYHPKCSANFKPLKFIIKF